MFKMVSKAKVIKWVFVMFMCLNHPKNQGPFHPVLNVIKIISHINRTLVCAVCVCVLNISLYLKGSTLPCFPAPFSFASYKVGIVLGCLLSVSVCC